MEDLEHLQRCLVCDRAKYFSHPSIVLYSLAIPPLKLKLGQQIGEGLLIANHLDESLWWANQKHWAAVRSYFLHSFLQVKRCCCTFHQSQLHVQECKAKTIFLSQTDIHWIFFIEFYSADHIPSTAGDALRRTRDPPQARTKGRVLNLCKSAFPAKSRDHTIDGWTMKKSWEIGMKKTENCTFRQ